MKKKTKIIIWIIATLSIIGLILGIVLPLVLKKPSKPEILINSKISMGDGHSSLLSENGRLFMWGLNRYGQLGDGTEDNRIKPKEITNQFKDKDRNNIDLTNGQILLGIYHSSLLTQDGRLFMWGNNYYGQLGDGTENDKNTPIEITDNFEDEEIDLTNAQISLGTYHSSLLTADGRLFMWGLNRYGQLGDGTGENKYTPIEITDQFEDEEGNNIDLTNGQISLGTYHSSLLTEDGRLFMWGLNNSGQLGNGLENNKNTPIDITKKFVDDEELIDLTNAKISMGAFHSSLLTEGGRLFMWGLNVHGQLGNGKDGVENNINTPTEITNKFEDEEIDLTDAQISLGSSHSSLLTEDKRLFMWGGNNYGQLGDGTDEDKNTPTEIKNQFVNDEDELIDLTNDEISLGGHYSSLLTADGRMFTWGKNDYGQLGDGTEDYKNKPIEITNNFI